MKHRHLISALVLLLVIAGVVAWRNRDTEPAKPASVSTTTTTQPSQPAKQTPSPATFDKKKYSNDSPTSIWVVVNKTRPLSPKDYAPADLISVGGGQQMRKEAAAALATLIADAKKQGLTISALSGYRSYTTQVSVYNNEVKNYGQATADTESARPGTSEHQTGLAVDVGGGGCGIEDCFGKTAEGKWLATNAYKYGFIIRYTTEKQPITGYRAEPWHIRYIGTDLSTEMQKQGVTTLEEFFNLPAAPNYP